ncbi:hypothetical protein VNO78_03144 [Psophocarpus tetragonolobus]|uniref:Uncharacterized protein n=1 Tax=Psophocarpus tetragonolobus TaxID=3891 RepID=A0AAN9XWD4_PSOTE
MVFVFHASKFASSTSESPSISLTHSLTTSPLITPTATSLSHSLSTSPSSLPPPLPPSPSVTIASTATLRRFGPSISPTDTSTEASISSATTINTDTPYPASMEEETEFTKTRGTSKSCMQIAGTHSSTKGNSSWSNQGLPPSGPLDTTHALTKFLRLAAFTGVDFEVFENHALFLYDSIQHLGVELPNASYSTEVVAPCHARRHFREQRDDVSGDVQ